MGLYIFHPFDFAESKDVIATVMLSEEHWPVKLRDYRCVKGEQLREIGVLFASDDQQTFVARHERQSIFAASRRVSLQFLV